MSASGTFARVGQPRFFWTIDHGARVEVVALRSDTLFCVRVFHQQVDWLLEHLRAGGNPCDLMLEDVAAIPLAEVLGITQINATAMEIRYGRRNRYELECRQGATQNEIFSALAGQLGMDFVQNTQLPSIWRTCGVQLQIAVIVLLATVISYLTISGQITLGRISVKGAMVVAVAHLVGSEGILLLGGGLLSAVTLWSFLRISRRPSLLSLQRQTLPPVCP